MFKTIRPSTARSAAFHVLVVEEDRFRLPGKDAALPADLRRAFSAALRTAGFKGKFGDVAAAGEVGLVFGLGKRDDVDTDRIRNGAGRIIRAVDRVAPKSVQLHLSTLTGTGRPKADAIGQAFGEGMGLANWRVDAFDGAISRRSKPKAALSVICDPAMRAGFKRGLVLADGANTARRLGATPPNICRPSWIAKEAKAMAKRVGLSCRVITAAQAKQLGMGGLLNVGRGSSDKPCLVVLEHKPKGHATDAPLVLVGKTITFDTGGYSLKQPAGMKGMKYDKCGGCAIFGAMEAIGTLNLKSRVIGLLPAAENMVSDDAYRPDDIIKMYSGATVEVTNTDAEGRLVLADALAYACEKLKPRAIVDMATLTGGVVVALGSWCAGLWGNDDDLLDQVEAAAEASGERVWQMPLWEEHRDFMRARHADLWNSAPSRDGHPIQGAAFLSHFVDDEVPWAHLDIAGVAKVASKTDLHVHGPTGYGVRLLTALASM